MFEQRFGDWIETYTGVKFYPLDPRLEEIVVEDMIHAVCNICRFGGHSKIFYSVGQHSLMAYRYLTDRNYSPSARLYGLTHDFTEAYQKVPTIAYMVDNMPFHENVYEVEGDM